MVFCYLILKPILHITTYDNTIEEKLIFLDISFFSNGDRFNDVEY
jgi:hypothetical protein